MLHATQMSDDTLIKDLPLSVRARNALLNAGARTVGEVKLIIVSDLVHGASNNCGTITKREIALFFGPRNQNKWRAEITVARTALSAIRQKHQAAFEAEAAPLRKKIARLKEQLDPLGG